MTEAEAINWAFQRILSEQSTLELNVCCADVPLGHGTPPRSDLLKLQDQVDAMLIEYDKALADPQTKMPTLLHMMIEALRP